jgi:hypothetical protein
VVGLLLAGGMLLAGCDASSLRRDPTDESTKILGRRAWVTVTTDGGRHLVTRRSVRIERGDTALDVLGLVADVRLDPRTGAIAQVNGEGGGALRTFGPEESAWYYRVDGIESRNVQPHRYRVQPGQSIWWDLRRYDIYERLPVSISEFPEPLFTGWRDNGRPLRIAYGSGFQKDAEFIRDSVFRQLDPDIVSIAGDSGVAGIGGEDSFGSDDIDTKVAVRLKRANFIIARWEELRLDPNISDIATNPREFGLTVWVEGTDIYRQDPDMEFSQQLRDAEGFVWASTTDGEPDSPLVFVVSGITDEGVRAALRALRVGACQFYLACAVDRDGRVLR